MKCNGEKRKKNAKQFFSTLKVSTYHASGIQCIGAIEVIGYQTSKLCVIFHF
jgi:hypothetical protein